MSAAHTAAAAAAAAAIALGTAHAVRASPFPIVTAAILITTSALLYATHFLLSQARELRRFAHLPGPPASLVWGNAATFGEFGTYHELLVSVFDRFGPLVRLHTPLGGQTLIFSSDLDFKRAVVRSRDLEAWGKPQQGTVFPNSLLQLEGARHLWHRKMLAPLLSERYVRLASAAICEELQVLQAVLREAGAAGQPAEVYRPLLRFVLDSLGRVAFGQAFGSQRDPDAPVVAAGVDVIHGLRYRSRHGRLFWLLPPHRARFAAAVAVFDAEISRVLSSADGDAGETNHLVGVLRKARDPETGAQLSRAEIRDHIFAVLLAGHETTGGALAWAVFHLAAHPEAQARARAEVQRVVGARAPCFDDIAQLPFLAAVLRESARLIPSAPTVARRARRDVEVNGVRIPEGAAVFLSSRANHRDAALWGASVDEFDPDREAPADPLAFTPFGAGARQCVGKRLAQAFSALALAAFLQLPPFELAEGHEVVEATDITTGPKESGLWLSFSG